MVEAVAMVRVVVQAGVQVPGENVPLAPDGSPDAVNVTGDCVPEDGFAVMLSVTDPPAVTERVLDAGVSENEAGAVTVRATVVFADVPPAVPLTTTL